jgi:hypothetical protein
MDLSPTRRTAGGGGNLTCGMMRLYVTKRFLELSP